jgi:hypothetical protein
LFASARFRAAASELARALEADGVAVVDGALGERHATAVGSALRAFRERERRRFQPGALDRTGRSNAGARGDVVAWLAGDEGLAVQTSPASTAFRETASPRLPADVTAGVVAQWMRSCLGSHLLASLPAETLLPADAYAANAMLSAYAPGAPGFVPHTDRSSPSDPRRVTAVYYPARERVEDEKGTEKGKGSSGRPGGDGGELVLRPSDADRRRVVEPRGDRLVAFWSDEVEHEVRGVRSDAREERLALSFWFLKPR